MGDDAHDAARFGYQTNLPPGAKPFDVRVQERVEEACRRHPNMDMTSWRMVWAKAEAEEREKYQPIIRLSRYARWTRHRL